MGGLGVGVHGGGGAGCRGLILGGRSPWFGAGVRMMGRNGLVLVVDELRAFGSKTWNLDVGVGSGLDRANRDKDDLGKYILW